MTEAHAHEPASAASPFTDVERAAFIADDKQAAGYIVKLMVGIFCSGLVLYGIVALICASGHP